jgi:hypothetical protein
MSDLKAIQFSLARALEDGGGGDKDAEIYVSEIATCIKKQVIKLLEERFAENVDHCEWGTHLFLDNAIELIKGETNE